MLKFLSKVRIEYKTLDPKLASCVEFLAQCNARKAKESNQNCQVLVKRRTDDQPPQITVTFVNGVEEAFDAAATSAQSIRKMILDKGQYLETEQMFREAGEQWPVIIPDDELYQEAPGVKICLCLNSFISSFESEKEKTLETGRGKQKTRSNAARFIDIFWSTLVQLTSLSSICVSSLGFQARIDRLVMFPSLCEVVEMDELFDQKPGLRYCMEEALAKEKK